MITNEAVAAAAASRGRSITIVLWTLQVFLGVFFIVVEAIPKLTGNAKFVEIFELIGFGQWLRYFVAVAELAGGIALVIPLLSGLAAFGLSLVTLGAVIAQLAVLGATVLVITPALLTVILVLLALVRIPETRSLITYLNRSYRRHT